jgi:hypothetical protein
VYTVKALQIPRKAFLANNPFPILMAVACFSAYFLYDSARPAPPFSFFNFHTATYHPIAQRFHTERWATLVKALGS